MRYGSRVDRVQRAELDILRVIREAGLDRQRAEIALENARMRLLQRPLVFTWKRPCHNSGADQ